MSTRTTEKQVKVFVSAHEQRRIRLAAAIQGMTMSRFCRETVLAATETLTKSIHLTAHEPSEVPATSKRGRVAATSPGLG